MEKKEGFSFENKEGSLSFVKATDADVDAFLALEETAIGPETYSGIKNREEALQEFKEKEVYLIYQGDTLVGSTEFQIKSPECAYLAGVVVHPDFQGQGIAREAALFRLNLLKDYKRIEVATHPDNFKILKLYQSLGFKKEETVQNYAEEDGGTRIVMALER